MSKSSDEYLNELRRDIDYQRLLDQRDNDWWKNLKEEEEYESSQEKTGSENTSKQEKVA